MNPADQDHHAAAADHHNPALESAWKKGFEDRHGAEMARAMASDEALQKHLDSIHAENAVVPTKGTVIKCIDERVHEDDSDGTACSCGCGNAGSYILVAGKDGKPVVPSPDERAKRIMDSPDVQNSTGPITVTIHGEGDECGAAGIAFGIVTGRSKDTFQPGEVAKYDHEQGVALVDALRKVTNRPVTLKVAKTSDCEHAHPAQVIYITDLKPNEGFNANFEEMPQGMVFSRGMYKKGAEGRADFRLHLETGIGILTGSHGSGHGPIMVVVLTDDPAKLQALQAEVDAIVNALPEQKNAKGEFIKVIVRAAILRIKKSPAASAVQKGASARKPKARNAEFGMAA